MSQMTTLAGAITHVLPVFQGDACADWSDGQQEIPPIHLPPTIYSNTIGQIVMSSLTIGSIPRHSVTIEGELHEEMLIIQ